jgi:hypothetical protein
VIVVVKNVDMVGNDHAVSNLNAIHAAHYSPLINTGMVTNGDPSIPLGLQRTVDPAMLTQSNLPRFFSDTIGTDANIQISSNSGVLLKLFKLIPQLDPRRDTHYDPLSPAKQLCQA